VTHPTVLLDAQGARGAQEAHGSHANSMSVRAMSAYPTGHARVREDLKLSPTCNVFSADFASGFGLPSFGGSFSRFT